MTARFQAPPQLSEDVARIVRSRIFDAGVSAGVPAPAATRLAIAIAPEVSSTTGLFPAESTAVTWNVTDEPPVNVVVTMISTTGSTPSPQFWAAPPSIQSVDATVVPLPKTFCAVQNTLPRSNICAPACVCVAYSIRSNQAGAEEPRAMRPQGAIS